MSGSALVQRLWNHDAATNELTKHDKVNLDVHWLKDESLEEPANLPGPNSIAAKVADNFKAALEQFSAIAKDLKGGISTP